MRKNVSILQEGGPTPVLPTPPVIRAVLLHKQGDRVILLFLNCILKACLVTLGKHALSYVMEVENNKIWPVMF